MSSATTSGTKNVPKIVALHKFRKPITAHVFYTEDYHTWEMMVKIKEVKVYENAEWSMDHVLKQLRGLAGATKTVWASPAESPVMDALRMASPNYVNGPNLQPCSDGVQLELERVQPSTTTIMLNYDC